MITHDFPVDSPDSLTPQQQHTILRQLRQELITRYRPTLQQGSGPIRVMARLVHELESRCRELHIAPEIMRSEIMNRTIGDVNLRLVTECEGEPCGPGDYRMLAEEIGIALPGEEFQGYTAPGSTYLWLREQMQQIERELLQQGCDLRIYDLQALGNPVLRATLAEYVRPWGISASIEQVFPGLARSTASIRPCAAWPVFHVKHNRCQWVCSARNQALAHPNGRLPPLAIHCTVSLPAPVHTLN